MMDNIVESSKISIETLDQIINNQNHSCMTITNEDDEWDMDENPRVEESFVEKAYTIKSNDVEKVVDETFVSTRSLHIPFSRKIDLVHSFPILFPRLKVSPLEDPLTSLNLHKTQMKVIEDMIELKICKDHQKENSLFSSFYLNLNVCSSYFPGFSGKFHYFRHSLLGKHIDALKFVHARYLYHTYLIHCEMCANAYDKLLRSLSNYLVIRSS